MSFVLEIAVQSVEAAVAAQDAGADRIELCANLREGGVTPSPKVMSQARDALKIPIFGMIRPRTGNFVYNEAEFTAMREQINRAKRAQLDGVVLGLLTPENEVDILRTAELVAEANPLPVTFHRAFDEAGATPGLLEQVISTGAARLLTSGGAPAASQAARHIRLLIQLAENRILIVPGAGIHAANFAALRHATAAAEFHTGLGAVQPYDSANLDRFTAEIQSIVAGKTSMY